MKKKIIENIVGLILILVLGGTLLWVLYFPKRPGVIVEKKPLELIDPNNPFYTPPLKKEDIPWNAHRLKVSSRGFEPESFKVKRGDKVILVLTSEDKNFHSLVFEDKSLEKIKIIVEPETTRGIVFFAPEKPGEYIFFDGEAPEKKRVKGKMIVR